ncbi:hypothetical protein L6164_005695 [Bauhinia variegata]|uniref:Uncharacterized protein n=1 Tax=Bauhinia variegata TaxID=167791 RepID=A0ACB9PXH3_BAUVA|nr:hypothetical protein L6164_005695 [Bauhinia variegata]
MLLVQVELLASTLHVQVDIVIRHASHLCWLAGSHVAYAGGVVSWACCLCMSILAWDTTCACGFLAGLLLERVGRLARQATCVVGWACWLARCMCGQVAGCMLLLRVCLMASMLLVHILMVARHIGYTGLLPMWVHMLDGHSAYAGGYTSWARYGCMWDYRMVGMLAVLVELLAGRLLVQVSLLASVLPMQVGIGHAACVASWALRCACWLSTLPLRVGFLQTHFISRWAYLLRTLLAQLGMLAVQIAYAGNHTTYADGHDGCAGCMCGVGMLAVDDANAKVGLLASTLVMLEVRLVGLTACACAIS